jgi:membrane protease YdiL (CAAX protease family)
VAPANPATREIDGVPSTSALVPVLVALAAPSSVLAALTLTGNALVAFAVYHVGLCLVAPLAVLIGSGRPWPEVADHLALRAPTREGWIAGGLVGLATGGSILAAGLVVEPQLAQAGVLDRLAAWGVAGNPALLVAYMLVLNSGAEELLWRGYLHTEAVARLGPAWGIGAVSLLFASYHLYTLASLVALPLALAGTLGVLGGAVGWALLRERYASLVPALLAHGGATAGYMAVYLTLL